MKKTVWILRGCSGAGKDFVTTKLTRNIGWVAVSADDFFTDKEGNYNWDVNKLGLAHTTCMHNFKEALKESTVTDIIVNNTNTKVKDFGYYETEAKNFDADVIFLVVENRHGGSNVHSVPLETLERQEKAIRENLKLR
jgi:uridine kinase